MPGKCFEVSQWNFKARRDQWCCYDDILNHTYLLYLFFVLHVNSDSYEVAFRKHLIEAFCGPRLSKRRCIGVTGDPEGGLDLSGT